MAPLPASPSYSDCQGCSLCLLSCPMWLQKRDVRFSPQGIAKALQHGATADDMVDALSTCIDCGACDLLCPEEIDLTGMITALLAKKKPKPINDIFPMLNVAKVQQNLKADDFYIIDAGPFHANHAARVGFYDGLRQSTGCNINLDLNRMAIATGIGSVAESQKCFDVKKQIAWLIQGRSFHRMIVEKKSDQNKLAEMTGKPVIHVSDLLK